MKKKKVQSAGKKVFSPCFLVFGEQLTGLAAGTNRTKKPKRICFVSDWLWRLAASPLFTQSEASRQEGGWTSTPGFFCDSSVYHAPTHTSSKKHLLSLLTAGEGDG